MIAGSEAMRASRTREIGRVAISRSHQPTASVA
jgi:hypothetical protein